MGMQAQLELERLETLFDVVEAVKAGTRSMQTIADCLEFELDPMTCVATYAAELCTRAGLGAQGLFELHRSGALERLADELGG